jgi:hypothetical protein
MTADSTQLYKDYREMYDLSLASFRRFVKEPFEAVLWEDPVDDNESYTRANWKSIKDLWHNEPCNVFWAGADTLMTKPTSLFSERFREYRMFNYTDPKTHPNFAHHFNDDIQYYPHTMEHRIWKLGEDLWAQCETHPDRNWGFDQLRHNTMFWEQDIPDEDRCHPEMAYQAFALRGDPNAVPILNNWNRIDINKAHILHFHASRGSDQVIALMTSLCAKLGIPL